MTKLYFSGQTSCVWRRRLLSVFIVRLVHLIIKRIFKIMKIVHLLFALLLFSVWQLSSSTPLNIKYEFVKSQSYPTARTNYIEYSIIQPAITHFQNIISKKYRGLETDFTWPATLLCNGFYPKGAIN